MSAQREGLEALVETLADSTVVVDSSGSVTQVNASAEVLLGWGRGELVGRTVAHSEDGSAAT